MTNPALSVVMAVHNGEPYLDAAIDSVLSQSFRDFEFIVIDDCSTDCTQEIVYSYDDPRIIYRRNEENLGQTRSLNIGIETARAPFVARIDADDLFLPGKLEQQMAFLTAHPEITVLGTASSVIDKSGRVIGLVVSPVGEREIRFRLCRGVPVVHISVIMRTKALRAVGLYDPSYRYSQDYALWAAFVRGGYRIANLPGTLAAFRERADSVNTVNKLGAASDETGRIIQANAREFSGVHLTLEEARAIDLLMFPDADLEVPELAGAYQNLARMAGGVWSAVPMKIRAMLFSRLVWAASKRIQSSRSKGRPEYRTQVLRSALASMGHPVTAAGLFAAWLLSWIGFERVERVKAVATRLLLR